MPGWISLVDERDVVVVANRLPVDRVTTPESGASWQTSPGGLVTALQPVVQELNCIWVGWSGDAGDQYLPFEFNGMQLVPVALTENEIEGYYEGFSNSTLWPLYHDVIAQPEFHRDWWDCYKKVNQKFAEATAEMAPNDAIVWVHDYQLQLVPSMIRELRPDLVIVFFLHIPFPARRIFAQLPWRREIVEGLLGSDVVGFQRAQDAESFGAVAERYTEMPRNGNYLYLSEAAGTEEPTVLAQEFAISIDVEAFHELAKRPEIRARAQEIRRQLGDPDTLMLGVDRLDYTKGILHRLLAFSELLNEGEISATDTVFVQVASPSRERVSAYQQLRDDVEGLVGRVNGGHGSVAQTPVVYLHHGHSREEMVALYLAADVLVVTSLRDGMNLVAKEYVACRTDDTGVLVLSEFTGAADELQRALLINPHDIDATKAALLRAIHMSPVEQQRRMSALRSALQHNDVHQWSDKMLSAAAAVFQQRNVVKPRQPDDTAYGYAPYDHAAVHLRSRVESQLRRLATSPELIVICDFDGTIAPIVSRPEDARALPRAQQALAALANSHATFVGIFTGRSLESLQATGIDLSGLIVSGSHGAELLLPGMARPATHTPAHEHTASDTRPHPLTAAERALLAAVRGRVSKLFAREPGVRIETKPYGLGVHTRQVRSEDQSTELLEAVSHLFAEAGLSVRTGKRVCEGSVRTSDKGRALQNIRVAHPAAPVIFLGDDVTDEDAFAQLSPTDLGIKVGDGDTRATERVSSPHAAAAVLARLVELRTGIVIGHDPTE
ncbi:MAG: bifunctional alpha,alpha-trehalose-phosphate synthase (UDP-forming)/trehalose-phosphatase [Leucobacter sp.]|nr:bifunctional alpha,alpha-trehalose-phosphate synthase (UDP-forming)/trehalose-phosphatase [Leucobacter sp.]